MLAVLQNHCVLPMDEPVIGRPQYLRKLDAWKDHDVVKVLTGVRRCGKSTLMTLWKRRLIERYGIVPEAVIRVSLELLGNGQFLECHKLREEILRRCALPVTVGFPSDETVLHDCLDGILSTVLFKGVAVRLGVSNIASLDDERPTSHEGIEQVYALDWLLNEENT